MYLALATVQKRDLIQPDTVYHAGWWACRYTLPLFDTYRYTMSLFETYRYTVSLFYTYCYTISFVDTYRYTMSLSGPRDGVVVPQQGVEEARG